MSEETSVPYRDYPVLFVDDDEAILHGFSEFFKEDFTIHTAHNAEEALLCLQAHPDVAVIVTDQRMPKMGGVELLERVKALLPDTIRVLMTAYTDMEIVIEAINKGNVYRYVSKPYEEEQMRMEIMRAIEHYHLLQERNRLHAEKIETMKRMARANRLSAIGTLAAGMAHEINNPLVAVSTFLQMMPRQEKGEMTPEEWKSFYQLAISEVDRIKRLVADLLSYAKGSGTAGVSYDEIDLTDECDLNSLIDGVARILKKQAKDRMVEIDLKLDPKLPKGTMDADRICQVIMNLGLNAIQATANGKVIFETSVFEENETKTPFLQMRVIDTGIGISDQNLEKLFNPFFTTKDHGTGLGLMMCHSIIDDHRGMIDVQSTLGKGTVFIVRIPVDPKAYDRRRMERRQDL